jgi:hypothetical protein
VDGYLCFSDIHAIARGVALIPTIMDFPTVVQDALDVFGDLFANAPERRPFAEYLTALMIAEKKTVRGITREFVVSTDPSCLNRWLDEVMWDVTPLNDRRLAWWQEEPQNALQRPRRDCH